MKRRMPNESFSAKKKQKNGRARSDSEQKRQCQVDFGTVQLKEIHLSALDEMGDDGTALGLVFK